MLPEQHAFERSAGGIRTSDLLFASPRGLGAVPPSLNPGAHLKGSFSDLDERAVSDIQDSCNWP